MASLEGAQTLGKELDGALLLRDGRAQLPDRLLVHLDCAAHEQHKGFRSLHDALRDDYSA